MPYEQVTVYTYDCQSCGKYVSRKNATLNCDVCKILLCRSCKKGTLCPTHYNQLDSKGKQQTKWIAFLNIFRIIVPFIIVLIIIAATLTAYAGFYYENTLTIIIMSIVVGPIISLILGYGVHRYYKSVYQKFMEKYFGGKSKEQITKDKVESKNSRANWKAGKADRKAEKQRKGKFFTPLNEYKLWEYIKYRVTKSAPWYTSWIEKIDTEKQRIHVTNRGGAKGVVKKMTNIMKTDKPNEPFYMVDRTGKKIPGSEKP